uniref:RNA-directed DNA polymerase from transposon X-element n=1 Tax=Panagrellus redivivus TaxID=6233 RepID=A0A7E4URI4_PANRE
ILHPTHKAGNILDLLLTNRPESISNLQVAAPFGSSDHFSIHFDIAARLVSPTFTPFPLYSKADFDVINQYLLAVPWTTLFADCSTIDDIYSIFMEHCHYCIQTFVPRVTTPPKDRLPPHIVSMTNYLNSLIQKKSTPERLQKINRVSKDIVRETKKAAKNKEKRLLETAPNKGIFSYIGKSIKTARNIPPLKVNHSLKFADFEKGEAFANHFKSVFHDRKPHCLHLPTTDNTIPLFLPTQ